MLSKPLPANRAAPVLLVGGFRHRQCPAVNTAAINGRDAVPSKLSVPLRIGLIQNARQAVKHGCPSGNRGNHTGRNSEITWLTLWSACQNEIGPTALEGAHTACVAKSLFFKSSQRVEL